ncbi:AAA domain-containing protein [Streptomyces sp. NPDC090994]|uniref:AAA domain-containing protein n=1 Tax=Streptomyces sp. NPDC090994 TaxID=3365969 RepID=UPI0037F6FB19
MTELGDETPEDVLDSLFTGDSAPFGPYVIRGVPVVVAGGRMIRATLTRPGDDAERFDVCVFRNVTSIVGELWEHEVRSLLRLQALGHPALPEFVDGRYDEGVGAAFTLTRQAGNRVSEEWHEGDFPGWAAQNQAVVFDQYSLLVDALSQLHGARIMHRNVTPAAITIRRTDSEDRYSFALGRFEMSALLGNLVQSMYAPSRDSDYRSLVNDLYLEAHDGIEPAHHLAYLAPETWPSLFSDNAPPRRDWASTDVFGLGVFGWELFCGPLAENLPEAYAAVAAAAPAELPRALQELHARMRAHLNVHTAAQVPRELRNVLLRMLDPEPRGRCSSFEAARALEENWEAISSVWSPQRDTKKPYLVAFMPVQSVDTLYRQRHWISRSPVDEAGREELQAFLERELRQAELVWVSGGAKGYVYAGREERLAQAEWVLIGERAVWFCAFLYDEKLTGEIKKTHDDTLVIKYVVDRRFAPEVLAARPRRRVGRMDLVPYKIGQALGDQVHEDRPSWVPITEAVKAASAPPDPENKELLQSMHFMLEYQGVIHRARQYAYRLPDDAPEGRTYVLEHDPKRDRERINNSPLLTAYAGDRVRRPPLGDFADALLHEEGGGTLTVVRDEGGKPHFGRDSFEVRIKGRADADSVTVIALNGQALPERGWIRPAGDRGTEIQLRRMARGVEALRQKHGLMRALHSPSSIRLSRGQWSHEDEERTKHLKGNATSVIGEMLDYHPFYALQGPPGTGKTTVATHAVQQYLRAEPGARVLVSAQSNHALDHLGIRLAEQLQEEIDEGKVLLLRELQDSRGPGELPPALRPYTLSTLTEQLKTKIIDAARDTAVAAEDDTELSDAEQHLREEWARIVNGNELEISDRIKAGANIVLATCSIAGTLNDDIRDANDVFDWVIIEEAAKAWPTEIIMPLVLGVRWTLIGDHRQLGPHRATDLAGFLAGLASNKSDEIVRHVKATDRYLRHMALFGSLFAEPTGDATGEDDGNGEGSAARKAGAVKPRPRPMPVPPPRRAAEPRSPAEPRPLNRLVSQFRMHPSIAEPVARTFYQQRTEGGKIVKDDKGLPVSFLESPPTQDKRLHGLRRPDFLRDMPLVWLDTSLRDDCKDQPYWSNPGEAAMVRDLVVTLRQQRTAPQDLALLTPYAQQKKLLRKRLEERGLQDEVHTVHSFQGQEADLVVVSLVRSVEQGPHPRQNVGHVAQPELVNVLLSRARQLLVVVGDLRHFEKHGGRNWQTVIDVFGNQKAIVPAPAFLDAEEAGDA